MPAKSKRNKRETSGQRSATATSSSSRGITPPRLSLSSLGDDVTALVLKMLGLHDGLMRLACSGVESEEMAEAEAQRRISQSVLGQQWHSRAQVGAACRDGPCCCCHLRS